MLSLKGFALLALLFLSLPATADPIAGGRIFVPDNPDNNRSFLTAPGFTLTHLLDNDTGGWLSCNFSVMCAIEDIEAFASSGLVQFNSTNFIGVSGDGQGGVVGFTGAPVFSATSFNLIHFPEGDLTIFGTAVGNGSFVICTPPGNGCTATGQVFTFSPKSWHYVAFFIEDENKPGRFFLENLTLTTVPEPHSILLLATGLGVIVLHRVGGKFASLAVFLMPDRTSRLR
jgi:hypothetical protein